MVLAVAGVWAAAEWPRSSSTPADLEGARAGAALPAAPVEVTEIAVDGAPTMVAAADGAVWVVHSGNRGRFRLAQIDPTVNSVVTETALDSYPVDVVAWDRGAYVAVDLPEGGGKIVSVERFRGGITGEVHLDRDPHDLALGAGALWVGTPGGTIVEVDRRTDHVREIAGPSQSVAADGSVVWGAAVDGAIEAFDARSGERRDTLDVGWNIVRILAEDGHVWAAQQRPDGSYAVVAIDPAGATVTGETVLPANGPGHLALGGGLLWVTQGGERGGERGSVVRLDPRTGEAVDAVRVGAAPTGIAYGAGAGWVANFGEGTVMRLDPAG